MKHLTSWSVFEKFGEIPGQGDLSQKLSAMGIDGLEIFTLFEKADTEYYGVPQVVSVHLPYAIDWHSAWEGRYYGDAVGDVRYFSFGRNRGEMVANLRYALDCASELDPEYGVLHAANTDLRQVLERKHRSDNISVLSDFADFLNETVSGTGNGEPPFRIVLENLWWEGLTLSDPAEWRILEKKLEFDNWGFVLDTGHLMNFCDDAYDEDSAIDAVLGIVDRYPSGMLDRLTNMHLQLSTSGEYRASFVPEHYDPEGDLGEYLGKAYGHVGRIDQHRPFTSPRVNEIIDAVKPDYVVHELFGNLSGDRFGDIVQQRKLVR